MSDTVRGRAELKRLRLLARDLTEVYRTAAFSMEHYVELAESAAAIYARWGPYNAQGEVDFVDDLAVKHGEEEHDE